MIQTVPRHWHLDGLRGLACVQVMLLHGFGGFLPMLVDAPLDAQGWLAWCRASPLRLLWDGDSAVFLFFTLSGTVLTPAFARHADTPWSLLGARVVRLAIPAVLACAFAWLVVLVCGDAQRQAGLALGSPWLSADIPAAATLGALWHDGVVNALVLGYAGLSLWDHVSGITLWPGAEAFDPPLWTMSVELQGSVLVLGLVLLRRHSIAMWRTALALACVLLLRSPFLCFVVGHVAMFVPALPRWVRAVLLLGGAMVAVLPVAGGSTLLATAAWPVLPALSDGLWQKGIGAMAVFLAVHRPARLCVLLESGACRWLGRVSFPLYLVHWPLMYGPGSAVASRLVPMIGPVAAGGGGLLVGLSLSLLMAVPFSRVDEAAQRAGRRVRAWLAGPACDMPAGVRLRHVR